MGRATYLPTRRGPSSLTELGRAPTIPRVPPQRQLTCVVALAAALALAAAGAAQTRADPALQRKLATALRVPHVRPGQTGALAVELDTGQPVFARNSAR